MIYYCVRSTYRAGGNVFKEMYQTFSDKKPNDSEDENIFNVVVKKYFTDEKEAVDYLNGKNKS